MSPNAGGGASGCAGAAGAAADGINGTSGVVVAGTGATGAAGAAGAGSAGAALLVVSGVLVDAAGVGLGYIHHHLNTASTRIVKQSTIAYLRHHQHQKVLLFDRTRLHSFAVGQHFAYRVASN